MSNKKTLGYCVKSNDWTVQWQSDKCLATCGQKLNSICKENCKKWSEERPTEKNSGAHVFKNKVIDGKHFDVVVVHSDNEILSLLCSVENEFQEALKHYESHGLTERETEIMMLRKEGLSHKEIRQQLFISESTLKTHIRNAQLKLKDAA